MEDKKPGQRHDPARAAELDAVLEAVEDGVVICGADGAIRQANSAAAALLGDERARAGTIVERLDEAFEPADAPFRLDSTTPVLMCSRPEADRWIEVTSSPIPPGDPDDATPPDRVVIARDVTASRRRDLMRAAFVDMLSHQLRTPMTTIYGGAKLLARPGATLDDETRQAIFEDIVTESDRLQRLVEDVVALIRFGGDREQLGREPVLLQRLIPATVASVEGGLPDVQFHVSIPPGLPTVVGDAAYLEQVLRNLLSNAAKHVGPSERVDIVLEEAEGEVLIRVLDEGPGLEPGHEGRVFDLSYRSPRTAGIAPGAGIGLFVSARLVRAMGGRIVARRRPRRGAEFTVALPEEVA